MGRRSRDKQAAASGKAFARDGFANLAAKLGAHGADNLLAKGGYDLDTRIVTRNRAALDGMYRGSWIVGKLVDAVAEDMTRAGVEVQAEADPASLAKLNDEVRRLRVWSALGNSIRWGRLYGGAIAVIIVDGQDVSQPLRLNTVGKGQFRGLRVFDRWTCTPSMTLIDTAGPDEGLPESYKAQEGAWNGRDIHHSRVIRFTGFPLPYFERKAELYWGASVVERLYDRLLAFDSTTHGAANLVFKAHLRTVGIEGLREILATGGPAEDNLVKMFQYIRLMQSNEGITLLDKEDVFQAQSYTFAGLDQVLLSFGQQISGATGIPLVRLFGQSPAGLSATGESDLRNYYDMILAAQEEDLRPGLEAIYDVVAMSQTGNPMPDGWALNFRTLRQLNDVEKAQVANTDAQTVEGLFSAGLITEAQALKELRQNSAATGRFTNITDEDIEQAKTAVTPPPASGLAEGESAGGSMTETIQEVSLNGAQVTAMVQIVSQVAAGQLPRAAGVQMLLASFPINAAQAEAIMGKAGAGFSPASPEAIQAGGSA